MSIEYSDSEKRLLGIGTKDNKPQYVRTINVGEFVRCAYYQADTLPTDYLKTEGNIIIHGALSIGALVTDIAFISKTKAVGESHNLSLMIYGKNDKDSYDEIKEIAKLSSKVVTGVVEFNPEFNCHTLYEYCLDETKANFEKHKKDTQWYLGVKVATAYTTTDVPTGLSLMVKYCEGTPSEMPLKNRELSA